MYLSKMNKRNKGFTLVELIVVIAVIALLAVGAVLAFSGIQRNARRSNLLRAANNLAAGVNNAITSAGGRPDVVALPGAGVGLGGIDHAAGVLSIHNTDDTTITVRVPAGGGMGEEDYVISFASQLERDNARAVIEITHTGAAPNVIVRAEVLTAMIEGWDGTSALGGP